MKKKISIFGLVAFASFALHLESRADFGSAWLELSDDDKRAVLDGEQVTKTEETSSVWPVILVYQRVKATPQEVMAVFTDFAIHKEIFEGFTTSEVKEKLTRNNFLVNYVMTFPVILGIQLKDEHYTANDLMEKYLDGAGYVTSWTKNRTDTIKDIHGNCRVEPLPDHPGESLIAYNNFVDPPKPNLARLIRQLAVKRTQQTIAALANQTLKEKAENPAQLEAQLSSFKGMVD